MTTLKIYNTLTKNKEDFKPLKEGEVSIYVCGPTVYDFLHVGNFRGPVFFNLVRNWLEKSGYKVRYVSNFTDIDDKILARSLKENVDSLVISERYIAEYKTDYQALSLRPHDMNPKVTEHLADIESMIAKLIENGKAYEVDGEVLYSVRSFSEYGKLSKRDIDDMRTGTRVEPGEKKRDVLDFALWKPAKPGEPSWPSRWGAGRPGWHIECSAMIAALLGDTIDIHGGGMDLIFPHHENEMAQSEGASGSPFVKYWMHWNMINFGDRKMSKSIGNVKTAREFLKEYHPEIYKFMILSVHYRSISDFSEQGIERAIAGLARIYSAMAQAERVLLSAATGVSGKVVPSLSDMMVKASAKLSEALDDDFNTPEAFAEIFNVVRAYNATVKPGKPSADAVASAKALSEWIREQGKVFSLYQQPANSFLTILDDMLLRQKGLERSAIDTKVSERWSARLAKDFATSDRLRDELAALGVSISDTAEGTRWEVTK
ncbi:MAG: cysteine--tRNA ligase [Bdellovibrionales bacterium]|nr:cysteine--tRNA ligase [Bdellovibrionales bacterium]